MRAALGAAGVFDQCGRFAGDVAAQPFANRVAGTTKLAGGGLGTGDELLMQPMTICAHTREFKVGAMHAGRMGRFSAPQLILAAGA